MLAQLAAPTGGLLLTLWMRVANTTLVQKREQLHPFTLTSCAHSPDNLMTYHTIAISPTLWAQHTDGEPFTGTLAERIAFLEVLFHYEAQDNA